MIGLLDVDLPPHCLYHASPKSFQFPSREAIFAAREWSPWHANGVLGLWCSTFPKMCSNFGQHTYRVAVRDGCRRVGLPFEDFYHLTHDREDFSDLIAYLCERADVAYLVDANPFIGEVIVLNFSEIESFDEVTGTALEDLRIPLRCKKG
jgi:hypothetical protein